MPPAPQEPRSHAGAAAPANRPFFEPMALLLLSLATIGTAWCSFQAASWQGVSAGSMNVSAKASRQAAAAELKATQIQALDVMLFSQYINARASSNETLARFYAERFRGEARGAFQAWMATHPFENSNAPPHPFVSSLYRLELLDEKEKAEDEAQRAWLQAGVAGKAGRGYILVTVLLASALFCGGTAPKFDALWIRRTVLAVGLGAFTFAVVRLLALPIQT